MANNRIYLRCNVCGDLFHLAKSMGSGFYTSMLDVNKLNLFLDKHAFCCTDEKAGDEGNYSLEYESEPKPIMDIRE